MIHYPKTGHLVEMANKNRANPTEAEQNFIDFCNRMNIQYEFQVPIYCDEKGYILDFDLCYPFVENGKVREIHYVVEIDGGYHKLPEQQAKDKERTWDILQGDYKKVIRIPNKKTEDEDTLFHALYKGIPSNGKFGPAFREYVKKQYDNCRKRIDAAKRIETNKRKDSFEEIKIRAFYQSQIAKLQEEIETLKKTNWILSKEVVDRNIEINKWKERVEEVSQRIWKLSIATGNYSYYKDDYAVDF